MIPLCFSGFTLTSGQKVSAVVLHVDILSSCVHVSILSKLVGKKKSVSIKLLLTSTDLFHIEETFSQIEHRGVFCSLQLTEDTKCTAMVQHIDKDFAVISLDDTAQLTVIQTRSHLNEIILSESNKLKEGMCVAVEVLESSSQELQGLPLVSWQRSGAKRQRSTSETLPGSKGHRFGEVLQGKVRSVKPTCIQVTLEDGNTGSVHVSEVMEAADVCLGGFPTSSVKVGSVITTRVIGGREATSRR